MNSKKVILLYTLKSKIVYGNTEYLNELKKSNTFWLLVLTEFNFLKGFNFLASPLKNF